MTNVIQHTFDRRKVVLPVIHVRSLDQARANIEVAMEADVDGVWLIGHGESTAWLVEIIRQIREIGYPEWIGANFLEASRQEAFKLAGELNLNGIWVDNAGVDVKPDYETLSLEKILRKRVCPGTLYFGGFAFKGQPQPVSLALALDRACQHADVPTTSGASTGVAAEGQKLADIHAAASGYPIGIASGVTAENVAEHLPYVDAILVATGVNNDKDDLDPTKLAELIEIVRAY